MLTLIRLTAALIVVGGALAGLSCAQPELVSQLGIDVWRLPEFQDHLTTATDFSNRLDEVRVRNHTSAQQRDQVVHDLAHGKIHLPEAVALTCALSDTDQLTLALECLGISDPNREIAVAKLLIHWVEQELRDRPALATDTVVQLEKELAELGRSVQ